MADEIKLSTKLKSAILIGSFLIFASASIFFTTRSFLHLDAPRMTPVEIQDRSNDCKEKGKSTLLYTDLIGVYAVRCGDKVLPE
jgi:hypothetical protein